MPTKATLKLIKRLQQKKYRKSEGLFVVEGKKSVEEFVNADFKLKHLFVNEAFGNQFRTAEIATSQEFKQMSSLSTPPEILAVFEQNNYVLPKQIEQTTFVLDGIQDPGNLGTIIRLADWFGMKNIFCGEETVDVYNPKVIQASMGSLARVKVHFVDLTEFLTDIKVPVYGTFMDGKNLYQEKLQQPSLIVLGNEANGISIGIENLCSKKIAIPPSENSTESLNVAMAAAIVGSEFFRQKNYQ